MKKLVTWPHVTSNFRFFWIIFDDESDGQVKISKFEFLRFHRNKVWIRPLFYSQFLELLSAPWKEKSSRLLKLEALKIPEIITVKKNNKRPRYDEISGKYINITLAVLWTHSRVSNQKLKNFKQHKINKCTATIKHFLKALQNIFIPMSKSKLK